VGYDRGYDSLGGGNVTGRRTPVLIVRRGQQWHMHDLDGDRPNRSLTFGRDGDLPVIGDWNRDGQFDVGVMRGNTWYLRDSSSGRVRSLAYGRAGDVPLTFDAFWLRD
jgi:hypothetical protein